MTRSVGEGLTELRGRLTAAGIEEAAREARLIMAAALRAPQDRISLMQTDLMSSEAEDRLTHLAARRCAREPLAHILGLRAFYTHEFQVTRDVLDPRPETETLVRAALGVPFKRLLDLGTGSGCILISLLAARPDATGVGTDVSQAALKVAKSNSETNAVADRAEFVLANWFDGVEGQFDLIVSNPPYISASEMHGLAPELAFEPRVALTDERDGLTAYRAILAKAEDHLAVGGWLMVETGWTQGPAVALMFQSAGFAGARILQDLDGRDRVVVGIRAAAET